MTALRLLLVVLALALGAEAQEPRLYRVGVVLQGGASYFSAIDGLRAGLKELGFEDGKQFVLHVRDAKGDLKAVEVAAKGLENEKVDLIYTLASSVTAATKRATKRVPIVFYAGTDPVELGLIESFRKPGGRLTGIYSRNADLTAKRLELLKEMVPKLHRVVAFYSPDNPAAQQSIKMAREAAQQLNVEIVERPVASVEELRAGLKTLRSGEVDGLLYVADAMVTSQARLMIETARTRRMATIFQDRESISEGALASYGLSYYALGRMSAKYVQRVLLGANPADLPVDQNARLHFVINLKTAKAIGLTIPRSVLARADELVE